MNYLKLVQSYQNFKMRQEQIQNIENELQILDFKEEQQKEREQIEKDITAQDK